MLIKTIHVNKKVLMKFSIQSCEESCHNLFQILPNEKELLYSIDVAAYTGNSSSKPTVKIE